MLKKVVSLIVSLSMLCMVLTSCGSKEDDYSKPTSDSEKIISAFENTFKADSYLMKATCYKLGHEVDDDSNNVYKIVMEKAKKDDGTLLFYFDGCESTFQFSNEGGKYDLRVLCDRGAYEHTSPTDFKNWEDRTELITKNNNDFKNLEEHINQSPYHILTSKNGELLDDAMEYGEGTGFLPYYAPAEYIPGAKDMLTNYFKDKNTVPCITSYKNNNNDYNFSLDYDKFIQTLDSDYNISVSDNVYKLFEDKTDINEIKWLSNVKISLKEENDRYYINTLTIESLINGDGGRTMKNGKWVFEFSDINQIDKDKFNQDMKAKKDML